MTTLDCPFDGPILIPASTLIFEGRDSCIVSASCPNCGVFVSRHVSGSDYTRLSLQAQGVAG